MCERRENCLKCRKLWGACWNGFALFKITSYTRMCTNSAEGAIIGAKTTKRRKDRQNEAILEASD